MTRAMNVLALPDGRVIADCLEKVLWFCTYDAYRGYDALIPELGAEPDTISRDVLRAMNDAMRARSSVHAWDGIIGVPLLELTAVPRSVDLIDSAEVEYADARERLRTCYRRLASRRGITDVAASKAIYLKRPGLVAISDSYVRDVIDIADPKWRELPERGDFYAARGIAVLEAARKLGRANLGLLNDLQAAISPYRLSKARIIDILLWMQAKADVLYRRLFDAGCIKFGEFRLKSGILSPVYVDFRGLISRPKLLQEVGKALAGRAREIGCDRIAGIPYAGIPLGVAAALAGDIPMIYPRKEVKEHGTAKRIEGEFSPGEKVLVIDDIITDGASKIEAIEPLKEAGLVVTDVLVILDREQGGAKILERAEYRLHSLGKLSEVLDALVAADKVEPAMRARVAEFIAANQFA